MIPKISVAAAALVTFVVLWIVFRLSHRRDRFFFFDPRDCFRSPPQNRILPVAAETATFEPLLKHYLGVTQLLVTVSAASIAFGGNAHGIAIAKLFLACSVFYGVCFCAVLLWRYDEYTQDLESLTVGWYSTIFASGLSSLLCFMFGYLVWGFGF
jgi:hypothetical protein